MTLPATVSHWIDDLCHFAAAPAARQAADHTAITELGQKTTESAAMYADTEASAAIASAAEATRI